MRFLIALCVLAGLFWTVNAADPLKPREGDLKVGDVAPAFELKQLNGEKSVKLADLNDKPVVLIFGSCT